MEQSYDVIIIGAGAAGLAAAADLCAHGLSVLIVEATDRLGGRIFTKRNPESQLAVELGAEFVHGKAREIWNIIDRHGLPVCDVAHRQWQIQDRHFIESRTFWEDVDKILSAMDSEDKDMSFSDFLELRFPGQNLQDARSVALSYVEGFNAAEADRIGIRGLSLQEHTGEEIEEDRSFRFAGGYDQLIGALEDQLPDELCTILLSTPVTSIEWKDRNVTVRWSDNSGSAGCAVITVPLGVLQAPEGSTGAITFVPPVPHKIAAANQLIMGTVIRVVLRFDSSFWESMELQTDKGPKPLVDTGFITGGKQSIPTWWTQLHIRAPILVGWAAGPRGIALMGSNEDQVRTEAILSLSDILQTSPATVEQHLLDFHFHNWQEDPYFRGAYSYVPPEALEAQKQLAEPLSNTLFFAGEATEHTGHWSTVHGALATGHRAAREILATRA